MTAFGSFCRFGRHLKMSWGISHQISVQEFHKTLLGKHTYIYVYSIICILCAWQLLQIISKHKTPTKLMQTFCIDTKNII